ncbi:DUF4153 domain-containing protein [Neptunicella marina]|uniref:DUF4153 domain-containing protein n=1 Tax=Neptunicella marina TaxID=2125989 RepID=A0A8J6IXW0_9ALTE|nr:DUF4153 domain-containing protein [Neptunicella marina]MBC3767417.1 DUF4153 domain-containing protein [Neptunicella marina]
MMDKKSSWMNLMINHTKPANKLILLIALLQGLGLYLLHDSVELQYWPAGEDQWLYMFYSVLLTVPTLLLLGLEDSNNRLLFKITGGFGLVIALLAYYMGSQTTDLYIMQSGVILFSCIPTFGIACLKTHIYSQCYIHQGKLDYSELFRQSWRSVCTLALSLFFTLLVWGILMLWAALFNAIDIKFFRELFTKSWFLYPTLALANGIGIVLFRRFASVIDTIVGLLQVLLKFVLILLAVVTLLFLCTLPFSGLTPLWKSGGSNLILGMQLLLLFFVNAVYQDGIGKAPYSGWLHRLVSLSLLSMPLYSCISFYGLYSRVAQYGFTVDRCWGWMLWFVLTIFSVSYALVVIRQFQHWLPPFTRLNIKLGLVVLGLALLVNSPLLDFRKITVASQLARLSSHQIQIEDFDFAYFTRQLGKPGAEALEQLIHDYKEQYPQIQVRIDGLNFHKNKQDLTAQSIKEAITIITGSIPEDLYEAFGKFANSNKWAMSRIKQQYAVQIDMDGDSQADYLYIWLRDNYATVTLFYKQDNQWQHTSAGSIKLDEQQPQQWDEILGALKQQQFQLRPKRWQTLNINQQTLVPSEI